MAPYICVDICAVIRRAILEECVRLCSDQPHMMTYLGKHLALDKADVLAHIGLIYLIIVDL